MSWRPQLDERGVCVRYKDTETNEVISSKEYDRRMQMQSSMGGGTTMAPGFSAGQSAGGYAMPVGQGYGGGSGYPQAAQGGYPQAAPNMVPPPPPTPVTAGQMGAYPGGMAPQAFPQQPGSNPLVQPGARSVNGGGADLLSATSSPASNPLAAPGANPLAQSGASPLNNQTVGISPTAGQAIQGKSLRMEGNPNHVNQTSLGRPSHGFLDATSIAILLPTLVLLALIIAAAHKKRLFPWQTIRTFNPPSGLMNPRDYERSYLCPPNLRRHGRLGKRNPNATWSEQDGTVLPFGFLARTHLPVTIPMGRLPNKNMFIVAPSGSGKTTLMRAVIKALLAKPCVVIALEAKANDPNLDEKREGFKYTILPEAEHAGFDTLYFNPLDSNSIHWNPLDLSAVEFASSIVQDVNSLPPEEQHWAERDHGYIFGLTQLLKWGAISVSGEDENGQASEVTPLPCNPRGLMRLVNNRRNIVESLRRLKNNPEIDPGELSELTQMLSSIIRTDSDWDKNIQGVRGRLRMFKNPGVLRVTEQSNVDVKASMHHPTVLIFGAPASMGPDAESLAACFVYQLQQALHTRYGTKSVLPLFAFFDEYQTLNIDLAGRLSAIVRGANGGLTVILQNISQISGGGGSSKDAAGSGAGGSEIKTIFSNSAVRVCLHNADETTAAFFSQEIGKHAVVVPGISDHYMATGFGIFPTSWNRIHSQQVVARVDTDSIKRMEKHHALVYLAPAGDPEFGEVKPLMVDLRGIEEIARLHLLHNVSSRKPTPGGPDIGNEPMPDMTPPEFGEMPDLAAAASAAANGIAQSLPPFPGTPPASSAPAMPSFVQPGPSPAAAPAATTSVNGVRMCPSCNKAAGKGKFCIECGQFIGPAQTAQPAAAAQPQAELATSAVVINQPQQTISAPQQAPQPVPVGAGVAHSAQLPPMPAFASGPATADIPQRPSSPARKQSPFHSPAQIAEAAQQALSGNAYQAPGQPNTVLQGGQRQPMTSFNLDPSRLGYTQQQPQSAKKGGAKAGVEF
ncbi:MAG TPA: type IV secretory system conjugative DNA transfer family protein [Drouetiella sp.]|jgi:Type IV secretory system Conjugative DNA transfer